MGYVFAFRTNYTGYNETLLKGIIMTILIVVAVLSFIAGMLSNRLLTRKANAKLIENLTEAIDSKAFQEGFNMGWKHASMDWTNVRTSYEKFVNTEK